MNKVKKLKTKYGPVAYFDILGYKAIIKNNEICAVIKLIEDYLDLGGNLLWLTEPDNNDGLSALAAYFDIKRLPGQVVDATTRLFGIDDPTFAMVIDYPQHAINEQLHRQKDKIKMNRFINIENNEREEPKGSSYLFM